MLRAAGGSIVNTASIVGLRPGSQPLPYAASKAAVVSLTKLLALNLGPDIRVNAVAPGWMEGDWMQRMLGDRYDDLMARRAKATPLKRVIDAGRRRRGDRQPDRTNKIVNGEIIVDRRRLRIVHLGGRPGCWPASFRFRPTTRPAIARRGYWQDRSLRDEFAEVFAKYAERVALVDGERSFTYAEVDRRSTNLALNLLEIGLKPLDRVVVQLPNVAEFVILYFALQKIGAIPIAALVTHRFAEISQFAELSGRDDVRDAGPSARFRLHGDGQAHPAASARAQARASFSANRSTASASLTDLIEKPAKLPAGELAKIVDRSRPIPPSSSFPAERPAFRSSFRARTTITRTTRRSHRKSATSTATACCSSCCRSRTICRWRVPGFKASCSTAAAWCSARARDRKTCSRLISATTRHAPQSRAGALDPVAQRSGDRQLRPLVAARRSRAAGSACSPRCACSRAS